MKADMNVWFLLVYIICIMYCFLQFHISASPARDTNRQLIWIQLSFEDVKSSYNSIGRGASKRILPLTCYRILYW